ncbi:MAG: asparaginase [Muribaculaceae bacterium]|nr:asparaginase [Muribaculaceae bacterium]MBQ1724159.1 asparaginase [Muribaculaceae bacterium]
MKDHRPKILIIYTGGTIGMIENPETNALQPFDFSHLMENVPRVKKLEYDIDNIQFDPPIDSSNMNPQHWADIAKAIEDNYDDYDGFVVLHGTDTMAFTASALSFMLENLSKPVIITGSQLPIGEVRTDGDENLITALQVAAEIDKRTGEAMVQEVAILFENHLWRGNRSTKMSANNFNAFMSNNYPELARIGLDIKYFKEMLYRLPSKRPLKVRYNMDPNVMFLELHPGITPSTLKYLLNTPDIKGIVLKTYGAGNSPSEPWFTSLIREATDRGVVIVNVTQCPNGGVHDELYETGNCLANAGVVSGHDMTSEAAITKLMYLFGLGLSPAGVKRYFNSDLCGEVSL